MPLQRTSWLIGPKTLTGTLRPPSKPTSLAPYTAAHPNVTFAPRRVPSQDFNKQFKAAVAAGDPYDVIEINVQFLRELR